MSSLFSKTLKAGKKTYFIDVREARNNSKYITIAETKPSKQGDGTYAKNSIAVFSDQVESFRGALDEAIRFLAPPL